MEESGLSILQVAPIIGTMEGITGLGKYIRRRRENAGITSKDLADRVGIAQATMSRIETGTMKTLPEPEVIRAIARELGTRVDTMLAAAGYVDDAPPDTKVLPPSLVELHVLLDQVRWTSERTDTIRLVLRQWLENDKKG